MAIISKTKLKTGVPRKQNLLFFLPEVVSVLKQENWKTMLSPLCAKYWWIFLNNTIIASPHTLSSISLSCVHFTNKLWVIHTYHFDNNAQLVPESSNKIVYNFCKSNSKLMSEKQIFSFENFLLLILWYNTGNSWLKKYFCTWSKKKYFNIVISPFYLCLQIIIFIAT